MDLEHFRRVPVEMGARLCRHQVESPDLLDVVPDQAEEAVVGRLADQALPVRAGLQGALEPLPALQVEKGPAAQQQNSVRQIEGQEGLTYGR